jgi:hypothetical protein
MLGKAMFKKSILLATFFFISFLFIFGHATMVESAPPKSPLKISYPSSDCDGNFTVTWYSVDGATGYQLQRATSSSFSGAIT